MPVSSLCGLDPDVEKFYLERSGRPRRQCKECWNARNSELYRGKRSEYWRRHRAANREGKVLASRKWRAEHSESNCETIRKRQKENPSLISDYSKRRYVAMSLAPGTVTDREIEDMMVAYGNRCLCWDSTKKIQVDHIVPITKGGSRSIENLQPLCKSSNSKKHLKIIDHRKKGLPCQSMNISAENAVRPGSRIPPCPTTS
jgi:5-methylcytosine-specific restriction endonuclease McrA